MMTLSLFCRVLLIVIMIMPYSILYYYLPCAYATPTDESITKKPPYKSHHYYKPPTQRELFVCQGPAEGCLNGLWNEESCQCDCIPPYCRDDWGECIVPLSNCGGNPWKDCTIGEDCPWWPSSAENCDTGNEVPQGIYTIFTTKDICCQVSTYSKSCNPNPTDPPVAAAEEASTRPEHETIPLKLSLLDLPSVIDIRSLKEEIFIIVKRLLIDLTEKMSSLRITNFEENILGVRKNYRLLLSQYKKKKLRKLTQNLDIYYVVTVLTDPNVESFKPIVIKWMQDSYDLILEKIGEFTTREYFGYDLSLNWCTTSEKSNGQFIMCNTDEIVPTKLRIKDVGESFNTEELASGLVKTYKNILAGINGLEVTHIEVADIVRDIKRGYIDIFFNIHVVQDSGKDFTPDIQEMIEKEKDFILEYIQSYSDNNMTGLSWCQNDDIITTSCGDSGTSLWVIILATGLGLVPFCIINYYIVRCIRKRSDEENEDAIQSYLNGNVVNNNLDQHERKLKRPRPSISDQLPPEQSHFKKPKNTDDGVLRSPRHQQQRRRASNPHSSRRRSSKTLSSTSSKEILELCLQLERGEPKQEKRRTDPDGEHVEELVPYEV